VDLRQRARAFVRGLLSDLPRKNCWTIAEHAGDPNPDGMQHLLARGVWNEDKVRDDVRDYVVEHLGDPEAVLVIDETGDSRRAPPPSESGASTPALPGASRMPRVAVFLVYATDAGHAVIDRELYLPRSWTNDPERLQAAGVPDEVEFATKPALAQAMIIRALDAGVQAAWVAGDEVYGANPKLRAALEARGIGYVLAVACDDHVPFGGATQRADSLLKQVPTRAWRQISCGKGAKGHRLYDWAFLRLDCHGAALGEQAGRHWLMIRRNQRMASWPITAATHPARCRWPCWSGSRAGAGPLNSAFRPARACVAWTSIRCAAGGPGIAGSR
jgi:SRSO17 transposase